MPPEEVLILAMTKMLSGICTAGVTRDPDPQTGLRWVRPVRDFRAVQAGDMADGDGRLFECCDVVDLNLIEPRPDPPHVEDWLTDFVHHRPVLLRRLEGDRRARLFANHIDKAPEEVLAAHTRSLCLVQPEQVWVRFSLDRYSGKYEARMGFVLDGDVNHPRAVSARGVPVTDLKWLALGRSLLGADNSHLALTQEALLERLGAEALYLVVGLSRNWQGEHWPLVVGVHIVPDYTVPPPAG